MDPFLAWRDRHNPAVPVRYSIDNPAPTVMAGGLGPAAGAVGLDQFGIAGDYSAVWVGPQQAIDPEAGEDITLVARHHLFRTLGGVHGFGASLSARPAGCAAFLMTPP